MKKNTAILTSFIGGAVTGGLICFAVLKDKYDILLEEEVEEMKKYYEKEISDIDDDHFREMQDLVGELDHEERVDAKYVDYVKKYSSPEDTIVIERSPDNDIDGEPGIDESSYHEDDEDDEDEDDEDDEELEYIKYHYLTKNNESIPYGEDYDSTDDIDAMGLSEEEMDQFEAWDEVYAVDRDLIKRNEPYVISQEEFYNGNTHFDKITLSYFDVDDVLTDERDEVIPMVDDVIGKDSLLEFGSLCDDDKIVHVRNEKYGADYEVILTGESYIEAILGIPYEKGKNMIKRRD